MAPTGDSANTNAFNETDPTETRFRKLMGRIAEATIYTDETAAISMLRTNEEYNTESITDSDGVMHPVYPTITVTIEDFAVITTEPTLNKTGDEIEYFGYETKVKLKQERNELRTAINFAALNYSDVTDLYDHNYDFAAKTQRTMAFSQALDVLVSTAVELRNHRETPA